ncbi:MAG: trans-sulfuration enzyme family protein [Clostridia bacterium]
MHEARRFRLESRIAHVGVGSDPRFGAVTVPVYQAVTYQHPGSGLGPFDYTRTANPTRTAAEQALADLEGGAGATLFASGMAAITAVLHLLRQGDHIVLTQDLYGGTYRVLHDIFEPLGLRAEFVDTTRPEVVREAVRPETRLIFVETPSNPLLRVSPLQALSAIAHEAGALMAVDNTFMTFARQRPLDHGADLVLYSATKYLAGHNDVLAGLVVAQSAELSTRIAEIQNATGGVLAPWDTYLLLRGLKTLALRLNQAEQSARRIAESLLGHPAVARVFYPQVPMVSAEAARLHQSQASGTGAMVSFQLRELDAVGRLMDSLQLILPAVSLGGVESLITHPYSETHREFPEERRLELGFVPGLMRLSVGIEDVEDLVEDLKEALNTL